MPLRPNTSTPHTCRIPRATHPACSSCTTLVRHSPSECTCPPGCASPRAMPLVCSAPCAVAQPSGTDCAPLTCSGTPPLATAQPGGGGGRGCGRGARLVGCRENVSARRFLPELFGLSKSVPEQSIGSFCLLRAAFSLFEVWGCTVTKTCGTSNSDYGSLPALRAITWGDPTRVYFLLLLQFINGACPPAETNWIENMPRAAIIGTTYS